MEKIVADMMNGGLVDENPISTTKQQMGALFTGLQQIDSDCAANPHPPMQAAPPVTAPLEPVLLTPTKLRDVSQATHIPPMVLVEPSVFQKLQMGTVAAYEHTAAQRQIHHP